jgi:hypothetical protein
MKRIWDRLEKRDLGMSPFIMASYSEATLGNIMVAMTSPDKNPAVAIHLRMRSLTDLPDLNKLGAFLKLVEVKVKQYQDYGGGLYVVIELVNKEKKATFSRLCRKIIDKGLDTSDERQLISHLISNFEKWVFFFN